MRVIKIQWDFNSDSVEISRWINNSERNQNIMRLLFRLLSAEYGELLTTYKLWFESAYAHYTKWSREYVRMYVSMTLISFSTMRSLRSMRSLIFKRVSDWKSPSLRPSLYTAELIVDENMETEFSIYDAVRSTQSAKEAVSWINEERENYFQPTGRIKEEAGREGKER